MIRKLAVLALLSAFLALPATAAFANGPHWCEKHSSAPACTTTTAPETTTTTVPPMTAPPTSQPAVTTTTNVSPTSRVSGCGSTGELPCTGGGDHAGLLAGVAAMFVLAGAGLTALRRRPTAA